MNTIINLYKKEKEKEKELKNIKIMKRKKNFKKTFFLN